MLCEFCKQREATIRIKKIKNGLLNEMYICEDCAKHQLFDCAGFDVSFLLTQIINMIGYDNSYTNQDKTCASCGTKFSDFVKTGKLGCEDCYENFEDLLSPILNAIGGNERFSENTQNQSTEDPSNADYLYIEKQKKLSELKKKLSDAIEIENYEDACLIRDEINKIQSDTRE